MAQVEVEAGWERARSPPSGPMSSPTRGGTLKWGDFKRELVACAAPPSSRRGMPDGPPSPVRGGTLRWGDLRALAPPLNAISVPAPIEKLDDLPVDELLGSLLSAALVPRATHRRDRPRRSARREDPALLITTVPSDLLSAIYEALADDDADLPRDTIPDGTRLDR